MMNFAASIQSHDPAARERFAASYRDALRHSRRVKRLKIMLPVGAVVISSLFVAVSFVRAWLPENIKIESARIEDGKVVMEKPAISGRNEDGISYSMAADRALQSILHPDEITLQTIRAAMPVNADVIARVIASEGIFNRGSNMLDMTKPFTIALSSGIEASFGSAHLDINGGTLETVEPVNIRSKQASIVAQTMKMSDKGQTITFRGKVRVTVDSAAIHPQDK